MNLILIYYSCFVAQRDAIDQIFVMLGRAIPLMRIPTNFMMTRYFNFIFYNITQ